MRIKQKYIIPIIFFVVALVLVANLGQWFVYLRVRRFSEDVFKDNLMVQARLAASSFKEQSIANIYYELYTPRDLIIVDRQLARLKSDYNYFNVRLMSPEGEPLLGSLDDDTTTIELNYDLAPFLSASAGIAAVSDLIAFKDHYLLSAYAPIVDTAGLVTAVIGIDADYRFFRSMAEFKHNLLYINILSLVFIVVFSIGFIFINRRLLSAQEALYRASALSSMGQMAATMAHEVKNPLGIIKATASRIKSKYGKDENDEIFDYISEEVDRLNEIIGSYLDFARPAEFHQKREKTDLSDLLQEVIRQTRTDFKEADVEINFEHGDDRYPVEIDRNRIKQAVLNLLLNARDSYPAGGKIDVRLSRQNSFCRLEITDYGRGLVREIQDKLFQPFVTGKARGSGLGLYISRRIIKDHKGRIEIANHRSGGVCAVIQLPLVKE